jgi:hypothetical protein
MRDGGAGTRGGLAAEAGIGGGGTIRRGGTSVWLGGGGRGERACGEAVGVSVAEFGSSTRAVSRLSAGPSAGRPGGKLMRTVSFLGSLGSAMGRVGENLGSNSDRNGRVCHFSSEGGKRHGSKHQGISLRKNPKSQAPIRNTTRTAGSNLRI